MLAHIYMKTCLFPHAYIAHIAHIAYIAHITLVQTFEVCSRIGNVNMNFCTLAWKLVRSDDDSQDTIL